MSRDSKGQGHITPRQWEEHATRVSPKRAEQIYTQPKIVSTGDARTSLDPIDVKKRECLPSAKCPHPTPICFGIDFTGSMEPVFEAMIKQVLGPVLLNTLKHKSVTDPQIMLMAIGDANHENGYDKTRSSWVPREMESGHYRNDKDGIPIPLFHDRYPLQMTQFEIDKRILDQLQNFTIADRNGGNNMAEGYGLAMYAAATRVDSQTIREGISKGILITIGDEMLAPFLRRGEVKMVFGNLY